MEQKVWRFSTSPCPHTCIASCYNIPRESGIVARITEYVWTSNIIQSPGLTLGFILGVLHSVGLDKWTMARSYPYSHYRVIQRVFPALKFLSVLPVHLFPSNP